MVFVSIVAGRLPPDLERAPLCETTRPDGSEDRFPRYAVRLTNDWQVTRHAAPNLLAVGNEAD